MHAIYVPLKTDVKAALLSRAQREDRDPRREAARLIRETLVRDGDLTDCPGNALYASLPEIRSQVSALGGTPAQLTTLPASALITAGSSVELSGILQLLSGQPAIHQPLQVRSARHIAAQGCRVELRGQPLHLGRAGQEGQPPALRRQSARAGRADAPARGSDQRHRLGSRH